MDSSESAKSFNTFIQFVKEYFNAKKTMDKSLFRKKLPAYLKSKTEPA